MAPTTCSGFSAARAARNFAPAVSVARGEWFMRRRLRLLGDLYDSATGNFPVHVGLERARQFRERDRPLRNAREMTRRQVRGNASPHFQALGAWRRRGIDAEQVHAAQDER